MLTRSCWRGHGTGFKALVHQDDLTAFIAPCLAIPATTVNWSGDEALTDEDWIGYLGSLVGVDPVFAGAWATRRRVPGRGGPGRAAAWGRTWPGVSCGPRWRSAGSSRTTGQPRASRSRSSAAVPG